MREKATRGAFLSPRRVSPFPSRVGPWVDFHARSRFARSTIPEEKWGTTRTLFLKRSSINNVSLLIFDSDNWICPRR